jgi:uncharacterized protein
MAESSGRDLMHVTLHLTGRCNFRCRYCYAAPHGQTDMSFDVAKAAVDLAAETCRRENPEQSVGIIFFGGEPLLRRDLIVQTIDYCRMSTQQSGQSFYFKVTTNGSLLDESFLTADPTSEVFVALSHDGIAAAHNVQRVDERGSGTFDRLRPKIDLLLQHRPYAPVMLVTTPESVQHYAESVEFLFQCGFRYLICSVNYGCDWTARDLSELKSQYDKLANWYVREARSEQKFYFSPFDVKIASHVFPGSCRQERCELGKRQISVAPTGMLFPCVQFVEDGSPSLFSIGDVWKGLDYTRRDALYRQAAEEKSECASCAIRERCNHFCGCLNRQATGSIEKVSPVLCAHEQITLAAADSVAERLFKVRAPMFIQKQYNPLFPIVSMAEDSSARP